LEPMPMNSPAPVRFATIGFGIMGERLLRAALAHDPMTLVVAGIWDPSSEANARLSAELPHVNAFASLAELLGNCDCVHIASPPLVHLQQLEQTIDAGVAALCEKPLAVDVAAAQASIARVRAKGGRAGVNFPFTSSFGVDQLTDWRAAGAVGTPKQLHIDVAFAAWPRPWQMAAASWLSKRADGGFTREVVSHFLFLTLRQLGPITLRDASAHYPAGDRAQDLAETSIAALLEAGGVPVKITGAVGTTDKPDHNTWALYGTAGAVRLQDWAVAERLGADDKWAAAATTRSNEEMRPLVLKRQIDKLVALTRGEPQDLATLDEALAVQTLVEAILHADA
jgi:predicted dehydrogenase